MAYALLLLYVALAFIRPFELMPELASYRIMFCIGAVASIASTVSLIKDFRRYCRTPQTYLMLGLILVVFLSRGMQGWLGGGVLALEDFGISLTLFFLILLNVANMRRLKAMIVLWALVTFYVLAQGLAGYHLGYMGDMFVVTQNLSADGSENDPDRYYVNEGGNSILVRPLPRIRALGFLNDPNDLAQAFVMVLPVLGLAWRKGRTLRNWWVVVVPGLLLLYGIYLTHSRGAIAAIILITFVAAYDRWGAVRAGALAVIPCTLLLALKFGGDREYSLSEESTLSRVDAWSAGLTMLRDSPLLGRGYNMFMEDHERTAHNSFVLCFAELGLAGYLLWMALLVVTVMALSAIASRDEDSGNVDQIRIARALRLSLYGFLAAAFFLSRTYSTSLYVLLGLAAALVQIARAEDKTVPVPPFPTWAFRTAWISLASIAVIYVIVRYRWAVIG